jgi:hypothetical protein
MILKLNILGLNKNISLISLYIAPMFTCQHTWLGPQHEYDNELAWGMLFNEHFSFLETRFAKSLMLIKPEILLFSWISTRQVMFSLADPSQISFIPITRSKTHSNDG